MISALCRGSLYQASRLDIDRTSSPHNLMSRSVFLAILISLSVLAGCAGRGGTGISREQEERALEYLEEGGKYYEAHKYGRAMDAYQKAIEITPGNAYAHYNLATTYERLNMTDEAIASYRQAIAIKPDEPVFHYDLGATFVREKKYDDALLSFAAAIKNNPSFLEAYYGAGWIYAETGKYPEAVHNYRKALDIDPYNVNTHFALGNLYVILGNIKMAQKEYDILSGIDPARADDLLNQINKKK